MKWELLDFKPGTVCYIARGEKGAFVVYKNATTRGKWAGGYDSKSKHFLLQPTNSLTRIQKYCRDNYYWEDVSDNKDKEPLVQPYKPKNNVDTSKLWYNDDKY